MFYKMAYFAVVCKNFTFNHTPLLKWFNLELLYCNDICWLLGLSVQYMYFATSVKATTSFLIILPREILFEFIKVMSNSSVYFSEIYEFKSYYFHYFNFNFSSSSLKHPKLHNIYSWSKLNLYWYPKRKSGCRRKPKIFVNPYKNVESFVFNFKKNKLMAKVKKGQAVIYTIMNELKFGCLEIT